MAVPKLYKGLKSLGNDYGAAFVATYREAKARASDPSDIPFSKTRLVHHGSELVRHGISSRKLVVKNFPDALYTFRARAHLPVERLQDGNFAIIWRGKGHYAFVKIPIPNRLRFPMTPMTTQRIQNRIPDWVRPYLGHDEQDMLTRIQAHDLIAAYLGLKESFRLQSHLRIGVKGNGQVEVDELYVGRTDQGEVGIAAEAKNETPEDCLNVSQLFGTAQALKARFPTMPQRLVGAKPDTSGRICLAEFAVANKPADVKQVRDWCAYEIV